MRIGLRTKIVGTLLLILGGVGALTGLIVIKLNQDMVLRLIKREKLNMLSTTIRASSSESYDEKTFTEKLKAILDQMEEMESYHILRIERSKEPSVPRITDAITSNFSATRQMFDETPSLENFVNEHPLESYGLVEKSNRYYAIGIKPITPFVSIAAIMVFDVQSLKKELRLTADIILLSYSIAMILMTIIGTMWLTRIFAFPIDKMIRAVDKVSFEDTGGSLDLSKDTELGFLRKSLDHMVHSIRTGRDKIAQQIKHQNEWIDPM